VTAERAPAGRDELAGLLRAALGGQSRLRRVTRLPGSSKKGVYRAVLDDESTAIVYIWAAAENYWPSPPGGTGASLASPFSPASGLDLFLAAHARLTAVGIRTPRLCLADASRAHYPADVAVVEDVPGPTLEALLADDPARARPVLERLGSALRAMHENKAASFGKVLHVDRGGASQGRSCEHVVLERAVRDLAEASVRDARIAAASARLDGTLRRYAALIRPRSDYSLIHGELGPDHVLVDADGRPVIIDIEGLMYFDAEWEHVFLGLRFGRDYHVLRGRGLDTGRLNLYRLAMHLSLVAGPLRLLDGDFPDREPMLRIAEYNARQVLALDQHPSG
jgi:hypothetical protein